MICLPLTERHSVVLENLRFALMMHNNHEDAHEPFYMCLWLDNNRLSCGLQNLRKEVEEIKQFISSDMATMGMWIVDNVPVAVLPRSCIIRRDGERFTQPWFSNIVRLCWIERALYLGELK